MAAMTLATFRIQYPEFAQISDGYVQAKLDQSESQTDEESFGDHFEEATGIKAAVFLWDSPFGATMRLDGGNADVKSRLLEQYKRLVVNVVDPSMVVTDDGTCGCPCDSRTTCF